MCRNCLCLSLSVYNLLGSLSLFLFLFFRDPTCQQSRPHLRNLCGFLSSNGCLEVVKLTLVLILKLCNLEACARILMFQKILFPVFKLVASLVSHSLNTSLHGLFRSLLFFLYLGIYSSLHFTNLSFRVSNKLALSCFNLGIPLLLELQELLLHSLAESAEQLLTEFLNQWLLRMSLNDLLKHGSFPLMILEDQVFLVLKEFVFKIFSQFDLLFACLVIQILL